MGNQVEIRFEEELSGVRCLALRGHEEVGFSNVFDIEVTAQAPLITKEVLGKWAFLDIDLGNSRRSIAGIVTRIVRSASSTDREARHRHRIVLESSLARLTFTRQSRVFQKLSLPEIAKQVLVDGGIAADRVALALTGSYSAQPYVVQYDETDATFLRRLCERGGFYFRSDSGTQKGAVQERIVLCDGSPTLAPELEALPVLESGEQSVGGLFARELRLRGGLRLGKVTLRDYDLEKPALKLEGVASAGGDRERAAEFYVGPAGFLTQDEGLAAAKRRLEAERRDARQITFETNAVALSAGSCFELAVEGEELTSAAGRYVALSLDHFYTIEEGYRLSVTAIPQKSPLRLAQVTPAPRIAGIHSAWVTGPEGAEIHPDELGRVRLRFAWDRLGPKDEKSSLPVRVAQPNTPESMVFPRIGWEVWVGFEDGDPERPYVLGRCYNSKQPPPYALPANKASTALRSFSSPGAGTMNSIEFNDTAGAQGLTINAGFGKNTTVGGNLKIQTSKSEERVIGAAQVMSVGGSEKLSIKQAYTVGAKSQTAVVGGSQTVGVTGKLDVNVGSETVSIGGALLEQIGSPAAIAASLANAALMAGAASDAAKKLKWLKGKAPLLAQGFQMGKGLLSAYEQGGTKALKSTAATMSVGLVAGLVPGGDAALLGVKEHALGGRFPWEPNPDEKGPDPEAEAALAAKAAAGGADAADAGNKNHKVSGNVLEIVGAAHSIATPASLNWETSGGLGQLVVGACHKTTCSNSSLDVMGAAAEKVGAHFVKSGGPVVRKIKTTCKTQCAALKMDSQGDLTVNANDINITCGKIGFTGSAVTFECGGSTVSFSDSGMMVKSGTVVFTKPSKQSGDTKH